MRPTTISAATAAVDGPLAAASSAYEMTASMPFKLASMKSGGKTKKKFWPDVFRALPAVMLACSLLPAPAEAQFTQQGPKLVGTGAAVPAAQGWSVSLSGDGNTALVSGPDGSLVGAAWVFTRSAGVWSQQAKLVGTGALITTSQGFSVSLSGDGDTAILGAPGDNDATGAALVFTRSAGVWSQQAKLVGTANIESYAGWSVSLSGDGSTAIVGGVGDQGFIGAAWVFTRSGGVWTQQAKLVGTGAIGRAEQGNSVSLSSDGNTAIVGGPDDNGSAGAAWVFTRAAGVWSQRGAKLVGLGAVGQAEQGYSVSLSGDGDTAIVGAPGGNDAPGAAWVFTLLGGVWSQQGAKLAGTDAIGRAMQGNSVSISRDGNTVVFGGPGDNDLAGAAWVFTRAAGVWSQRGAKLVGLGAVGQAEQGYSVSLSGDGYTAIVGGLEDNNLVGAAWVYAQPVFAGTPGKSNCHGQSVSALARQYKGLNAAAAALGYTDVSALQSAVMGFCEG